MMHQPARGLRLRGIDPTLLLAFLLPVFAWAQLTYPGYFVFRSGFLPIFDLIDRVAHLGDLGWVPQVGGAYGLLGGEGPLPYSLAALPALLGVTAVNAVKLVFALSLIMASVGAYLWARYRFKSDWAALVAALLYVFNPIVIRLVYSDGAFSQVVFLALMPWVFYLVDRAVLGRWSRALALALLVAASVWTQAGLAVVLGLMVIAYLLVLRQSQAALMRGFTVAALGLVAGLLLGGIGLLPAILRHGAGEVNWPSSGLLILVTPWIALVGAWIAARLSEMLPEHEAPARPALFAALIGLTLLLIYPDLQPVATSGKIPGAPLAIFGENEIALLSVQTAGTPGPSGSVALEVEWQALRPLVHDYTVFFHVIAGNGQRFGQLDTMPQAGKLPTSQWQPGEVVRDRYEAQLSPDAPIGGDYRYWLGWYLGATGERLTVRQGAGTPRDDKFIVKP